MNFFRPGGLNPSIAARCGSTGEVRACCIAQADESSLARLSGFNANCDPTHLRRIAFPSATWTPTTPTAARSITASPPTCASVSAGHYEFLASYTWSHAIDDSTDLQSTLTPQDSYYPGLRPLQIAV